MDKDIASGGISIVYRCGNGKHILTEHAVESAGGIASAVSYRIEAIYQFALKGLVAGCQEYMAAVIHYPDISAGKQVHHLKLSGNIFKILLIYKVMGIGLGEHGGFCIKGLRTLLYQHVIGHRRRDKGYDQKAQQAEKYVAKHQLGI